MRDIEPGEHLSSHSDGVNRSVPLISPRNKQTLWLLRFLENHSVSFADDFCIDLMLDLSIGCLLHQINRFAMEPTTFSNSLR